MRKLAVALIVLVALAVGLDRLAVVVATRQLASRVQTAEALTTRPQASIRGFPFLTQVFGGRYDDVRLTVRGLVRDGTRVDTVALRAQGVHVRLADALGGRLTSVPVDRGEGTVLLTFADLDALSRRYGARAVTFSSGGGSRLRLTGSLTVRGVTTAVSAEATIRIEGGRLRVLPLPGALDQVPTQGGLRDSAVRLFTLTVPLPALPFGLRVTGGAITRDGLTATATGSRIVIPVRR